MWYEAVQAPGFLYLNPDSHRASVSTAANHVAIQSAVEAVACWEVVDESEVERSSE